MEKNWEQRLIAIVEQELAQLEWLINAEKTGEEDTEQGDVDSQIARLGGLTDLGHDDGLPVSETTKAKLNQINEAASRAVHTWLSNR
tara:strand:- start:623 stop:883 length:261 start_codon:yes stop_codon:yes gene_type:complete